VGQQLKAKTVPHLARKLRNCCAEGTEEECLLAGGVHRGELTALNGILDRSSGKPKGGDQTGAVGKFEGAAVAKQARALPGYGDALCIQGALRCGELVPQVAQTLKPLGRGEDQVGWASEDRRKNCSVWTMGKRVNQSTAMQVLDVTSVERCSS